MQYTGSWIAPKDSNTGECTAGPVTIKRLGTSSYLYDSGPGTARRASNVVKYTTGPEWLGYTTYYMYIPGPGITRRVIKFVKHTKDPGTV